MDNDFFGNVNQYEKLRLIKKHISETYAFIDKHREQIIEDCMDGYTLKTHPGKQYFPIPENIIMPNVILYAVSKTSTSHIVGRIIKERDVYGSEDLYSFIIKDYKSGKVFYDLEIFGKKLDIVAKFWGLYLEVDIAENE